MSEGFVPSGIGVKFGVVGNVVAPAEDKFDGKLTELRIAVGHGYKDKQDGTWHDTSTTYLTYQASGEYAAPLHEAEKGDRVQISGNWSLETKPFSRKDGTEGLGITVSYGDFAIIDRKADRVSGGDGFTPETSGGGF